MEVFEHIRERRVILIRGSYILKNTNELREY